MPSKLFQKRKLEAARRAQRATVERPDKIRILIVCEGSKTEPNYFEEVIKLARLSRVEPHIPRDHNTSPTKLLAQARSILKKDSDFDHAFVVSDRDEFDDFLIAKHACEQIQGHPNIRFIYSDPCFEFWLILHFEMFDAPMSRSEAVQKLLQHIPKYEKGARGLGEMLFPNLGVAITNSKIVLDRSVEINSMCPSTLVHEMMEIIFGQDAL